MMTTSPTVPRRIKVFFARARLDRELASGLAPDETVEHALRAAQLLSARNRLGLAASIEHVLQAAEEPPRAYSAAVPLRRREVLEARPGLLQLAQRLRSGEPVNVRGVVEARELLLDGGSPLYAPSATDVVTEVRETTVALAA
jgi:hypothetical protein